MIETYKKSIRVIVEGLAPNINYNPIVDRKMRVITNSIYINDHGQGSDQQFRVSCIVEHYLTSDSEKTTIKEGIIVPYSRDIFVKPTAEAYVNMATGIPFKLEDYKEENNFETLEEAKEALESDEENYYMNEFEFFCYMFDTQAIILKDMIEGVITRRRIAGDFD